MPKLLMACVVVFATVPDNPSSPFSNVSISPGVPPSEGETSPRLAFGTAHQDHVHMVQRSGHRETLILAPEKG
jgi:hypothetical protein